VDAVTGFPRCPTPCDPDCEQPCHEVHDVASHREHDPTVCVATLLTAAQVEGAEAERERIRQLAIEVDAFYDAPCPDGVADCVHQDADFADLLQEGR
jgi:hypothetical protein